MLTCKSITKLIFIVGFVVSFINLVTVEINIQKIHEYRQIIIKTKKEITNPYKTSSSDSFKRVNPVSARKTGSKKSNV